MGYFIRLLFMLYTWVDVVHLMFVVRFGWGFMVCLFPGDCFNCLLCGLLCLLFAGLR